jgi:hypothetical protein
MMSDIEALAFIAPVAVMVGADRFVTPSQQLLLGGSYGLPNQQRWYSNFP